MSEHKELHEAYFKRIIATSTSSEEITISAHGKTMKEALEIFKEIIKEMKVKTYED